MLMEETGRPGPLAFFVRRWSRRVPLGPLFWRDMIVAGSLLNLAAAFGGLLALGFKADLLVAMFVFNAPLPYNFFIVGAVWRAADLVDTAKAASARFAAVLWLVAATVL